MPYEIAPTTSFATDEHVQEHLEGLLEDGHDEDEMKEFSINQIKKYVDLAGPRDLIWTK